MSDLYIVTVINVMATMGALVAVYVRISERLARLETHVQHILSPSTDGGNNRRKGDVRAGAE